MIQEKKIIKVNLDNCEQQQKLHYCLIKSLIIIETSLQTIQNVYSIVERHLEYFALICVCLLFGTLIIAYISQQKIKKLFVNQQYEIQTPNSILCQSCGKISLQFQCKICMVCTECNYKFHSQYLKICLDKNQLQLILRIIWVIIFRTLISIFALTFAMIKYCKDQNDLFNIFFTSLILGILTNSILLFLLIKILRQIGLNSIQNSTKIQIEQKQEICNERKLNQKDELVQNLNELKGKLTSISYRISEPSLAVSDQKFKQFQILKFLENKLGRKQNLREPKIIFETQPTPIIFEDHENDESQVNKKMQKLNKFTPQMHRKK